MIVLVLSGHAARAGQHVTTPINSHAADAAARRRNPPAAVGATSLCMCGSWNLFAVERAKPEQRWQTPLRDSTFLLTTTGNFGHCAEGASGLPADGQ
jgi:hypothetical protein